MHQLDDAEFAKAERRINSAVESFLARDRYLLDCDVNERTLTHKFAEHLQKEFADWDVDCEFNRNHDDPKRLNLPRRHDLTSDDLNATTVYPDIIVHRRGSDQNFIVIEAKKSTNPEPIDWDLTKLKAFQRELGYPIALFAMFRTGGDVNDEEPLITLTRWDVV